MFHRQALVAACVACVVSRLAAQPVLEFDAASIKAVKDNAAGSRFRNLNGRLKVQGSLRSIILRAYAVDPQRLAGAPGWTLAEQFDIEAVVEEDHAIPPEKTRERNLLRLQALLEKRFQLKVHRETRVLPTYRLVVAKGGPKLKAANKDKGSSMSGGWSGHMKFRSQELDTLADFLWAELERPVFDQTGLKEEYDFDLDFNPARPDPAEDGSGRASMRDDTRPSVFKALQEQLGLKLEPAKMPVELLVVDHVARPSGN